MNGTKAMIVLTDAHNITNGTISSSFTAGVSGNPAQLPPTRLMVNRSSYY